MSAICECGHPEDEHTGGDGCTRRVLGGFGDGDQCACRAFRACSDAPATPSASATRAEAPATPQVNLARRERMPDERRSVTRVFRLPYTHKTGESDVMQLYFTAGFYDDGRVGEIFVRADRAGSLARGTMDALATMVSIMLQYGIPVEVVVDKLRHHRFPPDGRLLYADGADPDFRTCTSVVDLMAQWLEKKCPAKAS